MVKYALLEDALSPEPLVFIQNVREIQTAFKPTLLSLTGPASSELVQIVCEHGFVKDIWEANP